MAHVIDKIEGEPIIEQDDGRVTYRAKFAVDVDGTGPKYGDPCAQNQTSLRNGGKFLTADVDRYGAVPPAILNGVKGVVLGCRLHCRNLKNGKEAMGVVGDVGPHKKLGEGSRALAIALGINPSPTSGGTDEHVIEWTLWPGVAADGYELQPS